MYVHTPVYWQFKFLRVVVPVLGQVQFWHNGCSGRQLTAEYRLAYQASVGAAYDKKIRSFFSVIQSLWSVLQSNLTHLSLDKMATILADYIFRCIFVNEKFCILTKNSLQFVHNVSIDKNPALVKIMAWCWLGDKPLSEPMLTRFTDAYMRH